ncbi:MAG: flagellar M-ring protein FliF [Paucibacter sp.]|nr:flagellar M-ring protein FliF [Roseateles sp.]
MIPSTQTTDARLLPAPDWRQRAVQFWQGRPRLSGDWVRKVWPVIGLALLGTTVVLMLLWRDQSSYKPLFGQHEQLATSEVLAVLDAEHLPYHLHPDSGQVLVPENQLGRARMLLATKGVVAKLPAGLELLDHNDPLGVSQFVQDVRFRRGLEGELAQSMMALDAVAGARVHLALAKSSSFVISAADKSSASVVLSLKPGRQLSNEQIAAAIQLVSGSVAGLDPQRVSLVDQQGHLLSARVDLSEGFDGAGAGNDAQRRVQDEVRGNVRELLAPVLGEQNYHLSVTAEINNDRVQETREQYGDAPKVTSEAMRDEQDRQQLALGVPGSLSNRPMPAPTTAASGAAPEDNGATNRKNASTRQYAYDRSITQVKKSRGRLERLNVALLLNDAAAPGGAPKWTTEQIANIERVLRSGLGIDAERGDKLSLSAMSFPKPPVQPQWWEDHDNWIDVAGWVGYGLALLLGYLLIARPVLRMAQQALAPRPVAQQRASDIKPAALSQAAEAPVLTAAEAQPALAAARTAVTPLLENYELPPPGSPVDVLVDHLKVLAGKEPERVAEVVKQWVQKKNGRSD